MFKPTTLPGLVKSLESTSSMTAKQELLEEVKTNPGLESQARFFFKNSLDSHIKFNIKKFDEAFNPGASSGFSELAVQALEDLSSRKVTGNAASDLVQEVFQTLNKDWANLWARILRKDPRCGLSEISIRKVWPDLFSTTAKLCKATSYSKESMEKNIRFPAVSQTKIDGARALMFVENGEATLYSSGFKEFHIGSLSSFGSHCFESGLVIDGELIFVDETEKPLPRKISNGLANKALKGTLSREEGYKARFIVWDLLTFKEYETEETRPYKERMFELHKALQNVAQERPELKAIIRIVDTRLVANAEEALAHFRTCIARGEEGTILKNVDFRWKGKRLKDCQKFKLEISSTLKIVGKIPGKPGTKYANVLGALECATEDGKVTVGVGTGLTDEDREAFWTDDSLIGQYVEVVHNGLIENESGQLSLFLPRFIEIRFDKTEADTLEVIQANSLTTSQLQEN